MSRWMIVLATLLLIGCGDEGTDYRIPPTTPEPPWENTTPLLYVAAPTSLKVGDNLVVLGEDFINPMRGHSLINFRGTFFDEDGGQQPVDLSHKAEVAKPDAAGQGTKLVWSLWPNIVFDRTGDHLGYFIGTVTVTNVGNDGSTRASDELPLRLDMQPSLIPRMARPTNAACQDVVSATNEDTPFSFAVEAVGVRPASEDAPLTFYWTFMTEQWQVATSYGTFDPNSVFPESGPIVLEDRVVSGRASSVADGGNRSFLFKIKSDILGQAGLKTLRTGKVPEHGDSFPTNVNVAVVDAAGKSVSLTIPVAVWRLASMVYDGSPELAERFPPMPVSDCMPGDNSLPITVSYSEDRSESRSRSLAFNYNASVGANFAPIPSNPFALGLNFSAGFGVDTSASVHSSQSAGLNISGQILPGDSGMFYRQTAKWYKVGKLVAHGLCGQTAPLGDAILTDWTFTPELATGSSCPPPSQLPTAEKLQ